MQQRLQPVRGTHDIFPEESAKRRFIEEQWRRAAQAYGFGEIATPVFEQTEVFHRTLGDTSDVVTKETYTFLDRGGDSLTLRPEFTASVVRAFISAGLTQNLPQKFFYQGAAFRYERPQRGRLRQFHQVGVELLGAPEPEADVEVIALAAQGLNALGLLPHVTLEINSLGDAASRDAFRAEIVSYFTPHREKLSEESKIRLEKNPLRILDSKSDEDRLLIKDAPTYDRCLSESARAFKQSVWSGLENLGVMRQVNVVWNPRLVRGLDYYNHTVFEFTTARLGAQGTVLAGGRYDGLVPQMGGPDVAGVGFAAGVERMLALMEEINASFPLPPPVITVIPMGEAAEATAWKLAISLREQGFCVDIAYRGNAKKRFQRADRIGAALALILGEDELKSGGVTVKDLRDGRQWGVALDALGQVLHTQLASG
ncbi:MAG: histidine--tRNA ligase [Alphaproteobacteria bacterium]|nr:histidine--tRNA ligase [Alphaproteobacteria bacterium]